MTEGRWSQLQVGEGRIESDSALSVDEGQTSIPAITRLVVEDARSGRYSNAQLDDLHGRSRRELKWRPPLTLRVRARFSHPVAELGGTAGFGFWNDPWVTGRGLPVPPKAMWFLLAAPPSNMPLALGVPGHGWKAASIDAGWPAMAGLAPAAPILMLGARTEQLHRRLWPFAQRALRVVEAPIDATSIEKWHDYEIEWGAERVIWRVDGKIVLQSDMPSKGPLGFVAWLDNQFMIATPRGEVRHGLVEWPGTRALEIERIEIERSET